MIVEKIQTDLKGALLAKNEIGVSTLRLLMAEIHNRHIALRLAPLAQGENLSDEEVVKVIRQQVKQRQEAIEAYRQGKRDDLVKKEQEELDILSKYLPQQMGPEELEKIVKEVIEQVGVVGDKDFGKIMGLVMAKVKGRADGTMVAEIVKQLI